MCVPDDNTEAAMLFHDDMRSFAHGKFVRSTYAHAQNYSDPFFGLCLSVVVSTSSHAIVSNFSTAIEKGAQPRR